MVENFVVLLVGGAAAFFILAIGYGVRGRRWFPRRLLWPDFIAEYLRFRKHPLAGHRWRKAAFWIFLQIACLAGLLTAAFLARELFGSHDWFGVRLPGLDLWVFWCAHGWHNAALWAIRIFSAVTLLNLFSALFLTWEDCRYELLKSFRVNKFVDDSAKMEIIKPYTYLLKSNAPFTIERVVKETDALQRSAGVMILGRGNAPPSGIVIIASRAGLPAKALQLRDLVGAESSVTKYVIGMNPTPVYHDFQQRPHVGLFGPTGQGKSTLGRAHAAQANRVNPNMLNIFVDIEGVDYAAASRMHSKTPTAGLTYSSWHQQSERLRNVVHVSDIATLERAMLLVAEEYGRRSELCRRHGVENIAMLRDVSLWRHEKLTPDELATLDARTSRILIFFDDFSSVYDEYESDKSFRRAMKMYRKFVSRGRKYMISTISLTGRPDFETFSSARDEIGWYGVGHFTARQGVMAFEQEVAGTARRGTFVYRLESPFVGTAVALGADVPLSFSDQSLVAALTASHARASAGTLLLGDWLNTKLHQVQHDEELEKVHEGVEKFLQG